MTIEKTSKIERIFFKFIGIVFILSGLAMYWLPVFIKVHKDYTTDGWYIPMMISIFGTAMYFYYREVGKAAVKAANKRIDNITDNKDEPDRP